MLNTQRLTTTLDRMLHCMLQTACWSPCAPSRTGARGAPAARIREVATVAAAVGVIVSKAWARTAVSCACETRGGIEAQPKMRAGGARVRCRDARYRGPA
jgi:hypothetical protein